MRTPKIGDKLVIVSNTTSHSYPVGTEVTVYAIVDSTQGRVSVRNAGGSTYTISRNEYKQKADLESLKNEMASLEKELYQVKKYVEYLELTGKTEAGVNEVNAYYVLQLVANKKLSDTDKAVEIARLLS